MQKFCVNTISKSLSSTFHDCLITSRCHLERKKDTILPNYKNSDKQYHRNYRPVSLLSLCGRNIEKLILKEIFKFSNDSDLIQSK